MRYAPTALILLATTLASCTPMPRISPGVRDTGAETLSAADAYPAIANALETGTEESQRFRVVSGNDEGETGLRRVALGESGQVVVAWTIVGEDEPRNENHLVRDEAGDLRVERMPNRERDVVTRFEPAFLHFPNSLTINEPVEQELRMLVADFDEPDRVTQRGDSVSTITLLGGTDVLVNGSPRVALVVRAELESTFGPARVVRVADRWFLPQLGFVGERFDETVRVFGLQSERRTREIWREGVEPMPESEEGDQPS